MKVSVLIPAYNSAKTIEAAVASVLRQTTQPHEIIVLLDGGTDDTPDRLRQFKDRILVVRQDNHGVAIARNRLVQMAKGDVLAFLDSDDLWHPKYLEVQRALLENHAEALVSFCGHADFTGAEYAWQNEPPTDCAAAESINQVDFFERYNVSTGLFGSMSFACVRRSAIERLGAEPFQWNGVEDSYLFYRLSLLGGVVAFMSPLVAYRLSGESLSANRVHTLPRWIWAFKTLEPEFQKSDVKELRAAFPRAYASKRRQYAKMLLGAGRIAEARYQLRRSMANCHHPISVGKSAGLWAASVLPAFLQPKWPSFTRENVPGTATAI